MLSDPILRRHGRVAGRLDDQKTGARTSTGWSAPMAARLCQSRQFRAAIRARSERAGRQITCANAPAYREATRLGLDALQVGDAELEHLGGQDIVAVLRIGDALRLDPDRDRIDLRLAVSDPDVGSLVVSSTRDRVTEVGRVGGT